METETEYDFLASKKHNHVSRTYMHVDTANESRNKKTCIEYNKSISLSIINK